MKRIRTTSKTRWEPTSAFKLKVIARRWLGFSRVEDKHCCHMTRFDFLKTPLKFEKLGQYLPVITLHHSVISVYILALRLVATYQAYRRSE